MIVYQNMDFAEAYPELMLKKPFVRFKKDKNASEICWYIYLFCSLDSEFRTYPPDVRQKELEENFLSEPVHQREDVQIAIREYEEHMMTLAQRNFKAWEDKLTERQKFIDDTPYDETSYEMLDKMMAQTSKMWDMFSKVKKELDKDSIEDDVFGSTELSDSEKGII